MDRYLVISADTHAGPCRADEMRGHQAQPTEGGAAEGSTGRRSGTDEARRQGREERHRCNRQDRFISFRHLHRGVL